MCEIGESGIGCSAQIGEETGGEGVVIGLRIGHRSVVASVGMAAGIGVGAGIEVRSALRRFAGVAPGSPAPLLGVLPRIGGKTRSVTGTDADDRGKNGGLFLIFLLIVCAACSTHPVPLGRGGCSHWPEA